MKNRPEIFQNERVSASAGSGKTYALTKRFIALAAKELDTQTNLPDPTKIIALTFTRKSAGEFLGNILTRLAKAASTPNEAKKLSLEIEELSFGETRNGEYITTEKAKILLKECVRNLNKMRLSTIDSFFSSALRAFTTESGIFSEIRIIDAIEKLAEKNKIIEEILNANAIDSKTFSEFAEIVKRASFGAEEKSLHKTLKENIENSQKKFIEVPDVRLWGNISAIIGNREAIQWESEAYKKEISALKLSLQNEDCGKAFDGVIKFFENSDPNTIGTVSTSLERIVELFAEDCLENGFLLPYNRKEYNISPKTGKILSSLLRRLCDAHIMRVCDASKAAAKIANMYETRYAQNVRQAGKLAFDDIPILLNNTATTQTRLLEYRLDSRFKHWLFDEFQDTSREQWKFFKNIIDETIAESSGEKTFYYVGDVKQSLYSWRGGDRFLFDEIFSEYNAQTEEDSPAIVNGKELFTSWRSGKNVIKAINSVFASRDELESVFVPQSARDFHKIFTPHISAETLENGKTPTSSLAQLRLVEKVSKDNTAEFENVMEEIFKIVKEIKATKNGETCAILVNNNTTAQNIVEFLRAKISEEKLDIEVSGELEKNIANGNMTVPAFMQILKFVAHPSDTSAMQYLAMTPLANVIKRENFRENALNIIAENGFEKFADFFASTLQEICNTLPKQAEENITHIKESCREFDKSELIGIDNFLRFISEKHFRLSSTSNAIQVMTIHKSKGLGFGTVILPDLHKIRNILDGGLKYITRQENGVRVQKTISYFPPKIICQMNEALCESLEIDSENESFENICKLYVALTRAEKAMYIIMPEPTKYDQPKIDIKRLLINAFCPSLRSEISIEEKSKILSDIQVSKKISIGDERWYDSLVSEEIESDENKIENLKSPKIRTKYLTLVPSKATSSSDNFDFAKIEFGNAIHKAFEFVDDSENSPEQKAREAVRLANIDEKLAVRVETCIAVMLSNPKIGKYFTKRENRISKSEFKFDILLDGKIARGSIDKLLVKYESNKPSSAVILDFKSTGNSSMQRRTQLEIYKTAVEKIFKIDPKNIETKIISYTNSEIFDF